MWIECLSRLYIMMRKSAFCLTLLGSKLFCAALSPVSWPAGLTVRHGMLTELLPVFPFLLHLFSTSLRTSYIDTPTFAPRQICTYNLLSPFGIVTMCTHPWLTTWDRITYTGACPGRNLILLPPPLSSHWPPVALHGRSNFIQFLLSALP